VQYKNVTDDRQMRALTGLSVSQFEMLVREFSEEYKKWQEEIYQDALSKGMRQRRPGGGAKGKLPTPTDKLFFLLVYLKTYPTFDVLSTQFNMSHSKSNENILKLMPIFNTFAN